MASTDRFQRTRQGRCLTDGDPSLALLDLGDEPGPDTRDVSELHLRHPGLTATGTHGGREGSVTVETSRR